MIQSTQLTNFLAKLSQTESSKKRARMINRFLDLALSPELPNWEKNKIWETCNNFYENQTKKWKAESLEKLVSTIEFKNYASPKKP